MLPVHAGVGLRYAGADRVDAVAAEDGAAGEEAAVLPVGEAEFGAIESVLAVHPAGEAVADEGSIHRLVEAAVHRRVLAHQAGDELRAVAVEERRRLLQAGDDL